MNKTVKKVLIICVCVVLFVGVAGAIWFWDMSRVIESTSEEILKIHNDYFEKTNAYRSPCAYSIEQTSDKITVTVYSSPTSSSVKHIETFEIKDNVSISHNVEIHYTTKMEARIADVTLDNITIKGNIVSGEIKYGLGKSAEDIISLYRDNYSHLTEIN